MEERAIPDSMSSDLEESELAVSSVSPRRGMPPARKSMSEKQIVASRNQGTASQGDIPVTHRSTAASITTAEMRTYASPRPMAESTARLVRVRATVTNGSSRSEHERPSAACTRRSNPLSTSSEDGPVEISEAVARTNRTASGKTEEDPSTVSRTDSETSTVSSRDAVAMTATSRYRVRS